MSSRASELSPELLAQMKAIRIKTQRMVSDVLSGEYKSAFKGRGMEFEKVREYQPGDDVRHIDWNVTARMNAPYVKEHREERELTVMLLVDASGSMQFGTSLKSKQQVAAEIASVLAYTAVKSHDRVGMMLVSDRVDAYIPPKKGRAHIGKVIQTILSFEGTHRTTQLHVGLEYLNRVLHKPCVLFLLSDFVNTPIQEALQRMARKHDVTAICITDIREHQLPRGLMMLQDAESATFRVVDGSSEVVRAQWHYAQQKSMQSLQQMLRESRVGFLSLHASEHYAEAMIRYFRAK